MTAPARIPEAVAQRRRPEARKGSAHETETAHQAFILSLPCLACGKPAPSEFATVLGTAGLGVSPNDRYLVPLCGPATVWSDCCHSRLHYRGSRRFWWELGLNPLDLARRLWRVSGNRELGQRVVTAARQRIAQGARGGEGARC